MDKSSKGAKPCSFPSTALAVAAPATRKTKARQQHQQQGQDSTVITSSTVAIKHEKIDTPSISTGLVRVEEGDGNNASVKVVAASPVATVSSPGLSSFTIQSTVQASSNRLRLPIRKNACVSCNQCFTCGKIYGIDCNCIEQQPRRGKNLPVGILDSRAKKLKREETEDFNVTMTWLEKFGNDTYRDDNNNFDLTSITEFSMCKAHSTSLYRAKKRANIVTPRNRSSASDQSADINGHDLDSYADGLTPAKRKKNGDVTIPKRPRPIAKAPPKPPMPSIPMGMALSLPFNSSQGPFLGSSSPQDQQRQSGSSSSASPLQYQGTFLRNSSSRPGSLSPSDVNNNIVVESISLKSASISVKSHLKPEYFVRNLAITNDFTFRNILRECELSGPPPSGKKIVIKSDPLMTNGEEIVYPLDMPIRSVIHSPSSSHVELVLALQDVKKVDWSRI